MQDLSQWIYIIIVVAGMILPEAGIALWWGSNVATRLKQLEKDNTKLEEEVDGINIIKTELALLKQNMDNQTKLLTEIRDKLHV